MDRAQRDATWIRRRWRSSTTKKSIIKREMDSDRIIRRNPSNDCQMCRVTGTVAGVGIGAYCMKEGMAVRGMHRLLLLSMGVGKRSGVSGIQVGWV